MPQDEPPHADMIATVKRQIERHEALLWTHNLPNATREDDEAAEFERAELERLRAVLAHLERTQWRPRSEIADTTLGLDTEVLGFQPDIGSEAEDEIPSRYGITTAGHLASGGWEKCTHYLPLSPPEREC